MADQASAGVIDFTNVKEGGGSFNKKRQPEGDYKAKITKVVDAPAKKDNVNQWCFTIQVGSGTYPYYCKHEENQYWKIRNLLIAAGMNVPKKKVKVDPNKLVGKSIAVTLEDDEYDGKAQSNIAATFPLSELSDDDIPDEDEDADTDDDDGDDEPLAKKKAAPAAEDDDDDEDDTPPPPKGLAALDRTALKAKIVADGLEVRVTKSMTDDDIRAAMKAAAAKPKPAEDDEDEDEDEAPAPPKKSKAAAKPADDDDDLEEIDIDDT